MRAWEQSFSEPYEESVLDALRAEGDFSEPFLRALYRRGCRRAEDVYPYLHPEELPLPDPDLLLDMDRAAETILSAIRAKKRICIYGDYDVDGVCATTILYRALTALGADVSYYIPLRAAEGYGMHPDSVRTLAQKGTELLVTVDNGISAHAEIELCRSLGMEVVVTDHHRCHDTLPDAAAVVCATRPGQDPRAASLCGGAVALLLAMRLGCGAERFLAIAALATVADVMPLVGFNRTIVARGVRLFGTEPGLAALLDAAGAGGQPVTETTLAFLIAPRINAAGRMGDARRAVDLLIAADEPARLHFAAELDAANAARKREEQRILTEAERQIDPSAEHRILMLCGEDWNPGVIGIVASRILEQYGCPVLLFTRLGGELVGSGRSIPPVDLFALLSEHAAFFTRFGGHALAAGAAMPPESFDPCRKALMRTLSERFPNGLERAPLLYEDTLALSECTPELCRELSRLAPFGEGNREPVFLLKGTLFDASQMGREGAHLSASLSDGKRKLRLVGFRLGNRFADWQAPKQVEALVTLKTNTFREVESVNAYLSALRCALLDGLWDAADAFLRKPDDATARAVAEHSSKRPDENAMRRIFVRLRPRLRRGIAGDCLTEEELLTLLVLTEAGVAACAGGRFFEQIVTEKKQIANGHLYCALHS